MNDGILISDYRHIVDSVNNRMKIDTTRYVYRKPERITKVYDIERKYLYVSSPRQKMCMRYNLEDISPISLLKKHEGLSLKNMITQTWDESQNKTKYFGKFNIIKSDNEGIKEITGYYHVFMNHQSFIDIEKDYQQSAKFETTFYYFDEKFNLVGGATLGKQNQEIQSFSMISFKELKRKDLSIDGDSDYQNQNKYEIEFVLLECIDEYFKDQYIIVNGFHIVKIVPKQRFRLQVETI
ncbi:UNKNOWN [Stylonychia lemnae]|uniref:Uncharacterized protein n=1 Tax=Stylonychia lemnae TaxID=5949 RepID=A0A078BBG1_STYLE|nr:UNKNOWN [Stylonychia lemnae]|eukprot:CDW91551.1 UNKNOWN [Stylonychia lemnae]